MYRVDGGQVGSLKRNMLAKIEIRNLINIQLLKGLSPFFQRNFFEDFLSFRSAIFFSFLMRLLLERIKFYLDGKRLIVSLFKGLLVHLSVCLQFFSFFTPDQHDDQKVIEVYFPQRLEERINDCTKKSNSPVRT